MFAQLKPLSAEYNSELNFIFVYKYGRALEVKEKKTKNYKTIVRSKSQQQTRVISTGYIHFVHDRCSYCGESCDDFIEGEICSSTSGQRDAAVNKTTFDLRTRRYAYIGCVWKPVYGVEPSISALLRISKFLRRVVEWTDHR